MKNQNYSNARCKALENKLIPLSKLKGIIDTYDTFEALKVIKSYGIGNSDIDNPLDFELLLMEETQKLYKILEEIHIDNDIKEYIMLPDDFLNAEIFYKTRLTGQSITASFNDGMINHFELEKAIITKNYEKLPLALSSTLKKLDSKENLSGKDISIIFKKGYYEGIKISDKDLIEIHKKKIDLINIGISFRVKTREDFLNQKLNGGTLDDKIFDAILSKDEKVIQDTLKNSYVYEDVKKILESNSLSELEKKTDNLPLLILDKYKYEIRDNVPSLRFIFMTLSEIKNIRIIFVGILNKLPPDEIKKRLRWQYER